MPIAPEITRIVTQAIQALAADESVVSRAGIDKERWLAALMCHMEGAEPVAHAAAGHAAREVWYAGQIEHFIRNSKSPEIENTRELDEIAAAARRANRIVQIRIDQPGEVAYQAKREIDCTVREFATLGRQYIAQGGALGRRGRFYLNIAEQMRLRGLSDDDTLAALAS